MPATAARIGFVTREFRLATAGPDTAVETVFGTSARETKPDEPVETFFIDSDDTQAMADERLALLKRNMRRFPATLPNAGAWLLALDTNETIPCGTLIDTRADADFTAAIVRTRLDIATGTASVEAWGGDALAEPVTEIDGGTATSVPADAIDGGTATSVPADAYDGGSA